MIDSLEVARLLDGDTFQDLFAFLNIHDRNFLALLNMLVYRIIVLIFLFMIFRFFCKWSDDLFCDTLSFWVIVSVTDALAFTWSRFWHQFWHRAHPDNWLLIRTGLLGFTGLIDQVNFVLFPQEFDVQLDVVLLSIKVNQRPRILIIWLSALKFAIRMSSPFLYRQVKPLVDRNINWAIQFCLFWHKSMMNVEKRLFIFFSGCFQYFAEILETFIKNVIQHVLPQMAFFVFIFVYHFLNLLPWGSFRYHLAQ